MLKCDLHIHTSFSRDGESGVEDVLKKAEAAGLDVIAITDHDTTKGAIYALGIDSPVLVIPGIEISTRQGHLLALGITEEIPKGLDFFETVRIAKELGALLILPHPYHQWRHGVGIKLKTAISVVDAVECFNSRYIVGAANKKAGRKAKFYEKPCVAGSDAHNARFVGYGLTLVDADKNVDSVINAIIAGKTEVRGKMTPLRAYTHQSWRNTKRKISGRVHKR
ncbi:PHP domain-containing protein [Methanoplanus sp. FWC-SCC4]|uniref:PHP domain-containing protein n=1 Tax=Methanochimaera problematica TaxID=2609417 RepID=A0AA97FH46_9EURY|nr:PHP domain-containing protein [Methanoplanus sp. FWC-SCC4]WOF17331.1 PHP domain-containing protein [Methanoplanus sp. FWC-SCC4]